MYFVENKKYIIFVFQGKKVVRLDYEAYEPMAIKEMEKLCNRMREKWPGLKKYSSLS